MVSYKKIELNVNMSVSTVRKYVTELMDKGLVTTENTTVTNKDGQKQNGCLRYTIRPIQEAVALHEQQKLHHQDKGVPPQAVPLQPQLPAVRAVCGERK